MVGDIEDEDLAKKETVRERELAQQEKEEVKKIQKALKRSLKDHEDAIGDITNP